MQVKEQQGKCCKDCIFGVDYGESVKFIRCERSKHKVVDKNQPCCKNFAEADRDWRLG